MKEELPVLRDGSTSNGGFENIVNHLGKKSNGQWDLDRHFSNQQDKADITAYLPYHISNIQETPAKDLHP